MWLPLTTVTLRAAGDASPERAWERYAGLDLWSTWSPQVRGVEADERRLRTGLSGRVVGPLGVRVPFTVTDVGPRSWTWEVRAAGATLVLHHLVLAHPGGSLTELRVRGPVPLALGYAPAAQLALRRLVRA
ncbi:MAG: SRPBCC family protein [Mycobacteriales bacterium]